MSSTATPVSTSSPAIQVSSDARPCAVEVDVVVVSGKDGKDGVNGRDGVNADGATDPGDLTLIFGNKLI